MAVIKRQKSELNLYHIMSRGVGKAIIFEDDSDRRQFMFFLLEGVRQGHLTLHAWCLMDNHYHLLLEGALEAISLMMRRLNGKYAVYFNERHGRVGHLFQGRFRSAAVNTDEYYLTVLRYIHQNPVRAGMTETCEYPWSSYEAYLTGTIACGLDRLLSLMVDLDAFQEFHGEIDYAALCLDVERPNRRLTVESLLGVARAVLGDVRPEEVAGLSRERRNEALGRLKAAGLSLRQIERVTGVSKSVVAKI